jgi:L-iditol 2-dehydrogenase
MKAGVFHHFRDIRFEDVPDPKLVNGDGFDVLVKVRAAGICGSDIAHFTGQHCGELPEGSVMGHELCGEVVEIGESVTNVRVGDRVGIEPLIGCGHCGFCLQGDYYLCSSLRHIGYYYSGGFAEYTKAPHEKVYKLPDNISYEEASTLDCYAVAVHGLHRVPANVGDTVVVFGAGPVGLCMAQAVKAAGVKNVVIIDVIDGVLEVAKKAGFELALNSAKTDVYKKVMELTGGRGADIVFDGAGGSAPILDTAVRMLRARGTLGVIGMRGELPFDSVAAHFKEIDIKYIFSYGYWDYKTEFEIALDLIGSGKINAADLITHRYALKDIHEAFAAALDKKASNAVKVVLIP